MRIARVLLVSSGLLLFAIQLGAQDFTKYRGFSLGMNVKQLSDRTGSSAADVNVILERPALVQELKWRPPQPLMSEPQTEAAQLITFSFFDGALYQISVDYDRERTEGLTVADVRQSLTAQYGPGETPLSIAGASRNADKDSVARWENPDFRIDLFQSAWKEFRLVMVSKTLETQASVASALALSLEEKEAPAKETERLKKEAQDLADARQKNKKLFRP